MGSNKDEPDEWLANMKGRSCFFGRRQSHKFDARICSGSATPAWPKLTSVLSVPSGEKSSSVGTIHRVYSRVALYSTVLYESLYSRVVVHSTLLYESLHSRVQGPACAPAD